MSSTLNLTMLAPERFQSVYNSLSPSEKEIMQQILKELGETGESETYEKVWLEDYEEIPVDIDTFLEDPEYLGKATNLGNQIYPFWREQLRKIFAGGDTEFEEIALTGAIGIGKTAIAVYAIAYLTYRLLCLKFPQRYFGFADTDEIAIFFFNATVALAQSVGYGRLHACLMESPWFLAHGTVAGSASNPYYVPGKHIVIKAGSKASHGLGQQIFVGFLDEVNFAPGSNTTIEKSKIMQTYSSVKARIKSRFIRNGKLLGKMFLVSSKKAEDDFLEVYLDKRRKENDADKLFIVDEPLWVVKPSDTYSGKMFKVAYGAKQLTPRVIEPGEDVEALRLLGYEILDVPIELESDFRFNIITALQDLAGKALPGTTSYFSYKIISSCYAERPSPFSAEILEIGCNDHMEYQEFFNLDLVPKEFFTRPMAIHLDTSLKNDNTGISGACYVDNVLADTDDGTIEKRVYAQVFSVGIKAPPGTEISMAKNRRFLYWLRSVGFNIAMISTDTYQTAESHQILRDKGFTTSIKSLDRTPEGYRTLREAMMEQRISLIHHAKLENELIYLQHDTHTGKLDHPANGCFTGDTRVQLVDGRKLTMLELVEEQQYRTNRVYSFNEETLTIEPKRILSAHQTKLAKKLVEVTLDNDQIITCTPEHRFMLRDGEYCEAQNLAADTSLMTIYQGLNSDGYSEIYPSAEYRRGRVMKRNHKVVSVRFIEKPTLVYDLTIEDNPNFALACGVFVHNSKDIADSLAGAVWDLSLLPYSPALHEFVMYSHEREDRMPSAFKNSLFGGLQPCDPTAFERSSDDWAFFDHITQMH